MKKKMTNLFFIVLIFPFIFPVIQIYAPPSMISVFKSSSIPDVTDGIRDSFWDTIPNSNLTVTGSSLTFNINFQTVHNGSRIFFAIEWDDSVEHNQDNVDLYFDIDEDLSWDQTTGDILDIVSSRNIISSSEFTAGDFYQNFTNSPTVFTDTSNSGTDDVQGHGWWTSGTYFIELSQELASGDTDHDIDLQEGDDTILQIVIWEGTDVLTLQIILSIEATVIPEFPVSPILLVFPMILAIIAIKRKKTLI